MPSDLSRRAALALAASLALAVPAAAADGDGALHGDSLLWRLDPPGGGPASYVAGTLNLPDARLQPVADHALRLLPRVDGLVVEVDLSDGAQLDHVQAMLLADGRTLPEIVGEADYARLLEIGAVYGHDDLFLRGIAPWAAGLLIALPPSQLAAYQAGRAPLDLQLMDAADREGLPVAFLETPQEQADVFSMHPEPDQLTLLRQALDRHGETDRMAEEMIALYLAEDLAGLAAHIAAGLDTGDRALTARVIDAVVTGRNQRMAERILPLIAERPQLVAIGASHLPGNDGVLNLLAQAGWTVTPLAE